MLLEKGFLERIYPKVYTVVMKSKRIKAQISNSNNSKTIGISKNVLIKSFLNFL